MGRFKALGEHVYFLMERILQTWNFQFLNKIRNVLNVFHARGLHKLFLYIKVSIGHPSPRLWCSNMQNKKICTCSSWRDVKARKINIFKHDCRSWAEGKPNFSQFFFFLNICFTNHKAPTCSLVSSTRVDQPAPSVFLGLWTF